MCQVQRVQNSCGHRNDHVFLHCRVIKLVLEYCTSPTITTIPLFAAPLTDLNAARHPSTGEEDLKCNGFHASNEPYCTNAVIYCLKAPTGFKCLVSGCETAD